MRTERRRGGQRDERSRRWDWRADADTAVQRVSSIPSLIPSPSLPRLLLLPLCPLSDHTVSLVCVEESISPPLFSLSLSSRYGIAAAFTLSSQILGMWLWSSVFYLYTVPPISSGDYHRNNSVCVWGEVCVSVCVLHYACVGKLWVYQQWINMRGGHHQHGCGCHHLLRKLLVKCDCCFAQVRGTYRCCVHAQRFDSDCVLTGVWALRTSSEAWAANWRHMKSRLSPQHGLGGALSLHWCGIYWNVSLCPETFHSMIFYIVSLLPSCFVPALRRGQRHLVDCRKTKDGTVWSEQMYWSVPSCSFMFIFWSMLCQWDVESWCFWL